MLSIKQEAVNNNFKVIGLTRLRIKFESTASKAEDLSTRPSELLKTFKYSSFQASYLETFDDMVLA